MELCAGLATPELKLACFEAIVASSKPPQIREADVVPEMAPAVDATPAVAPAVVATPESSPAVAATSAATVTAVADSDFGQEHLDLPKEKEAEKEDEIFRARVTNVTKDHYKVLYFHLDNGHVWRQMEARHFEYPKNGEFEINITRGTMGDYRLRIGEKGRMVRIRRVK